jgi:hypothetical protein
VPSPRIVDARNVLYHFLQRDLHEKDPELFGSARHDLFRDSRSGLRRTCTGGCHCWRHMRAVILTRAGIGRRDCLTSGAPRMIAVTSAMTTA